VRQQRVPDHAVVEPDAELEHGVLRPRCWSGKKRILASGFCSKAHSSATSALEDVQTTPPLRPQNALMSAEEFI
jgi:hypothetical protein